MIHRFRKIVLLLTGVAALVALPSCAKKENQLRATIDTSMGKIVVKLYDKTTPKTVANFVGLADGTRLLRDGEPAANAKPFYDGLTFHRVIPNFMIQGGDPNGDGTGGPGYQFEDETYILGEPLTGEIKDKETAEYVFMQLMLSYVRQYEGNNTPNELVNRIVGEMTEKQSFEPIIGHTVEEIAQAVGHDSPLLSQGKLIHEVKYGSIAMANAGPNTNGSQFFIVTAKDGTPWLNGKHTVFGEVIDGMEVAEAIQNVERGPNDKPLKDVVINSVRIEKVSVPVETDKAN